MKKQHPLIAAAIAATLSSTASPAKDKNPDFHPLLVSPANLQSWVFHTEGALEGIFGFVTSPQATSLSAGSLEIGAADVTQRSVFSTGSFAGLRLDDLKVLKFDMRRSTPASGAASPVLQLEMDFDLADSTTSSQGMLVYDPGLNGTVVTGTSATWNAFTGKWYMTGTAIKGNTPAGQPFTQASPGTLAQILAQFPDAGIRTIGSLSFKAGGGAPVTATIDSFVVGYDGGTVSWNFEPDSDRDSIPDLFDRYPNSDMRSKVDAGNGSTSISNSVDFNGSSIQDIVNRLQSSTGTHKKYVKEITSLAKELQKSRTITKEQAVELKNAADGSSIGTASVGSSSNGMTLSGGTLTVVGNSWWGNGNTSGLQISGGTLDLSNGYLERPLTLSGSGGIITNEYVAGGTPINLQLVQPTGISEYHGSVNDFIGLTKTGAGTLTLSGANTYTGATTISEGTLEVSGSIGNTSAITIGTGGTLRVSGASNILTLTGGLSNGGIIRVVPGSTLNASGVVSFVNDGVIDLTGGSVLFPAGFTNGSNGILLASSAATVTSIIRTGTGFSVVIDSSSGRIYQLQQAATTDGPFTNVGDALSGTTGATLTLSNLDVATLPGVYRITATP